MSKIDIDEFRTVLGVGTLYPDSTLQQVADAAENLIDGMLDYNRSSIAMAIIANNVATFYTADRHYLSIGSAVTVSGTDGTFNGSYTVLATGTTQAGVFYWTASKTASNTEYIRYKPYGTVIVTSQALIYDSIPSVREAALAVAVEIFQQRTAPGGSIQAIDFTPGPHRLGQALLSRVRGLLAPYMDMTGMVG
jgi:hypothetical protein